VVAALISLDFGFAHGAEFYRLLFSEFFCHKTVAGCTVSMPFITALKAHLLRAQRTSKFAGIQAFSLHHPIAAGSNAVSREGISFFGFFVLKLFKFCINIWLVSEQLLSLHLRNLRITRVVETLEVGVGILYLLRQICLAALQAELVAAGCKSPCRILVKIVGVADFAKIFFSYQLGRNPIGNQRGPLLLQF